MFDVPLHKIPAIHLFIIVITTSCAVTAHDHFQGYVYRVPKPNIAHVFNQAVNTAGNGFQVKLSLDESLPILNYFNPNVVESIIKINSEYRPMSMISTIQHFSGSQVATTTDTRKNLDWQKREFTKTTEKEFVKNTEDENKDDKDDNITEDLNLEITTEYTESTTDYDDMSTTEDYVLSNRIESSVVASLLG